MGFTGFVRDARIALTQAGTAAEDTDVASCRSATSAQRRGWQIAGEWRWTVGAGYRTIEGGADVEVFTFAWLNAAIVRAGVRF